jgi:hypothetical protein
MSWNSEYKESEIVADHTRVLSKIWDNLMPTTYPYVLEFRTNRAVEVHKIKKIGPYNADEKFIDYNCYVLVDKEPLVKIGWNGDSTVSEEMTIKAYGENYFMEMRRHMVELSKYAGLKIKSSFDFGGELDANVRD